VLAGWWRSWLVFVLAGVRTGSVRSWRSYWRCSWLAFVLAAFVAGGRAGWRHLAFGVWRSWLAFVLAAFVAGVHTGGVRGWLSRWLAFVLAAAFWWCSRWRGPRLLCGWRSYLVAKL
jgi:hypothetical protein